MLEQKIHYPEQFLSSKQYTSPLSLIPKFKDMGIMGMAEIMTALQLFGGVEDRSGQKPTTLAWAEVFEQSFGFQFNDIYARQTELFKRKPCNLTKTLDAMKKVLTKECRRRKAEAGKMRGDCVAG